MNDELSIPAQRIGFVAKRVAGTDGVSLEIGKWADVLAEMGHECYYITGESDRPQQQTFLIPEAHFRHPEIDEISRQCFGTEIRTREMSANIHRCSTTIKQKLHEAIGSLKLDLLIAENCLTIPMNIPLGIALVETLMETGIPCIAHHHDFAWERERFLVNAVSDYIRFAFPPALSRVEHVVINTRAAREFSRNTGLSCKVIPNVMNFNKPPPRADDYSSDFRESLGVDEDDILILQPTRVVQRKGIEHAIELVRRLEDARCKLVITHASADEGDEYEKRVRRFAQLMDVELIFADAWISSSRRIDETGRKRYTVWDAYTHADFVTYPSTYEGFGNAFLEAVYFQKPVLCNRYAIYRTDIEPCGFQVVLMDGYITDGVVDQVRRVLSDDAYREQMVKHNRELARKYFSYDRIATELRAILSKPMLTPVCSVGASL